MGGFERNVVRVVLPRSVAFHDVVVEPVHQPGAVIHGLPGAVTRLGLVELSSLAGDERRRDVAEPQVAERGLEGFGRQVANCVGSAAAPAAAGAIPDEIVIEVAVGVGERDQRVNVLDERVAESFPRQ